MIASCGLAIVVPATTIKTTTTTTTTAARKQVTTSRVTTSTGKNSGNQVLSRSTTYEYLKINESLVTENIPRSKVSAPRRDVVSSHRRQDYYISSGSERNSYIKNTSEYFCTSDGKKASSSASTSNSSIATTGYARSYDSNRGQSSVQVYERYGNDNVYEASYYDDFY